MGARNSGSSEKQARELRERIEGWRRAGRPGKSMPEELWRDAEELARSASCYSVAKAVGVSYSRLRERMTGTSEGGDGGPSSAEFFAIEPAELAVVGGAGGSQSRVEACIERGDGVRMEVRVEGSDAGAALRQLIVGFVEADRSGR